MFRDIITSNNIFYHRNIILESENIILESENIKLKEKNTKLEEFYDSHIDKTNFVIRDDYF